MLFFRSPGGTCVSPRGVGTGYDVPQPTVQLCSTASSGHRRCGAGGWRSAASDHVLAPPGACLSWGERGGHIRETTKDTDKAKRTTAAEEDASLLHQIKHLFQLFMCWFPVTLFPLQSTFPQPVKLFCQLIRVCRTGKYTTDKASDPLHKPHRKHFKTLSKNEVTWRCFLACFLPAAPPNLWFSA